MDLQTYLGVNNVFIQIQTGGAVQRAAIPDRNSANFRGVFLYQIFGGRIKAGSAEKPDDEFAALPFFVG